MLDAADARTHTAAWATLVTAVVVTLILLVTYRSPVLWLLPLVCVGVATVLTDAVTYLLGRFAGMTVDTGNAAVVTVLVFGVGTDYALLLLARYRDELRHEADRHVAMAKALRRAVPAIPAIAASAATVSLAAHYPAGRGKPVVLVVPSSTSDALQQELGHIEGVASITKDATSTDGTLVRLDATLTDAADSPAAASTVDRIIVATAEQGVYVGGPTAASMAKADAQAHDRRVVIPLVLLVVFAVLVLLLRSLVGPLLLMVTVVLSYLAALGVPWLLVDHVFGFGAMDVQLVLVGFLFLVALGVDYNIFLITRITEELGAKRSGEAVLEIPAGGQGGSFLSAVPHALAATGGVISSAGFVLAATFAALTVAPQVAFIEIGVLVAIGVLLDTLIVRSVLVPALVLDVGRRFWWPRG